MFKIFLCHRTNDSRYAASHIYQELAETYGDENVFEYNDGMPAGVDFRQHVVTQLQQMQVFVPLIGANWLDSKDENGLIRLQQHDDPVRIEVETALKIPKLRILPVFLDSITCPDRSKLPPEIAGIIDISAIHIGYKPDELKKGVTRLIEQIRTEGINPRPDPDPEIKRIKNELLLLEAEKVAMEAELKKRNIRQLIAKIGIAVSIVFFLLAVENAGSDVPPALIIGIILLVIAIIWLRKYNTKKTKTELTAIEKEILAIKSRLIALEGKGR